MQTCLSGSGSVRIDLCLSRGSSESVLNANGLVHDLSRYPDAGGGHKL